MQDLKEESERISRTHIVVATPGRLQQHMEQTWGFNADNLQMLGTVNIVQFNHCVVSILALISFEYKHLVIKAFLRSNKKALLWL